MYLVFLNMNELLQKTVIFSCHAEIYILFYNCYTIDDTYNSWQKNNSDLILPSLFQDNSGELVPD